MERILLAVDGSDHSMRAAGMAGQLSKHFGTPVDIINVVPESKALVSGAVHEYAQLENVYITERELLKSAGTEVIARAAAKVKEAGGKVDAEEVMIGSPAHAIASFAEGTGADCIVMGRRGLGDFRGLLMGSISHQVGHLTDTTLVTTQ